MLLWPTLVLLTVAAPVPSPSPALPRVVPIWWKSPWWGLETVNLSEFEPGCRPLPKATLDRIVGRIEGNAILSQLDIDRNELFDVYEREPLPAVRLKTWLLRELGPKVKLSWEATDCGGGNQLMSWCDLGLCVDVIATLPSGVVVHLDLAVGTLAKGPVGKTVLSEYHLRDRDGKDIRVYTFRSLSGMARELDARGGKREE